MSMIENVAICDGCGVEIQIAPVVVGERLYCCQDCLEGRGCDCGARLELDDERRSDGTQTSGPAGADLA